MNRFYEAGRLGGPVSGLARQRTLILCVFRYIQHKSSMTPVGLLQGAFLKYWAGSFIIRTQRNYIAIPYRSFYKDTCSRVYAQGPTIVHPQKAQTIQDHSILVTWKRKKKFDSSDLRSLTAKPCASFLFFLVLFIHSCLEESTESQHS